MSTIFPHLATVADDLCIIRSMVTEAINHDPAHTFMNTGTTISGRPAMGSWINYGLGSESDNLPGFVVLTSSGHFGQAQPIASRQWHSGFLPSRFQGVRFYSKGDPVLYIGRPHGTTADQQRDVVDAIRALDSIENETIDDPEIATRIAAYETAFRMQTSVPELIDLSERAQAYLGDVRHRRAPTARLAPTACWPAVWPSAVYGSSNSIIVTGTITARSKSTSREPPPRSIRERPHSSKT